MAKYIYCPNCTLDVAGTDLTNSAELVVGLSNFKTDCDRCGRDIGIRKACTLILTAGEKIDNAIVPVDEFDPVFNAKKGKIVNIYNLL